MRDSRVFVTGVGAVTVFGAGVEVLWQSCKALSTVTAPIPEHWHAYYRPSSRVWSPLPLMDFQSFGFSRAELLTSSLPMLLAAVAADEAISNSNSRGDKHSFGQANSDSTGVFVGTGFGGAKAPFDNYRAHLLGGIRPYLEELASAHPEDMSLAEQVMGLKAHPRVNPLVICQTMPNAISAFLGIRFGIHGPNETFCHACASGTVAIGHAFKAIRSGELELAVAGGVEHLSDRAGAVFMGFDRMQTLARPHGEAGGENRPFDAARTGFLFSEGGASFLVLESERSMKRRGAHALAEVRGYAANSDAKSMASMSLEHSAIPVLMDRLLNDAALHREDIGYINAHGTSTELNDMVEGRVIEKIFGRRPKVNSTKSILGHTIGASGALEAAVTVRSLSDQTLHGCRNLTHPIVDLDFCIQTSRHAFEHAISHNFGFGGHNAALLISKVE